MYVKVKGTVLKAFKMSGDIELLLLLFYFCSVFISLNIVGHRGCCGI